MRKPSFRFRSVAVMAAAALVLTAGIALAAQPKPGSYAYQRCVPGPGCIERINFSVKRGPPRKIKNFTYSNGFTCGVVEVNRAFGVNRNGRFNFSGRGTNPVESFPVTIKGKFVTRRKAEGTFEVDDDCLSETVEFTARYKAMGNR